MPDEPRRGGCRGAVAAGGRRSRSGARRDRRRAAFTDAPVPARHPFGSADRDKLVVGEHADPAVVEQYRHLAAVLHHAQKASGVRSVMVTSAVPAEGKTLTATNLALTLSQSYQRRVLLIDADLRRPRMREMFALPASEGLTEHCLATRRPSAGASGDPEPVGARRRAHGARSDEHARVAGHEAAAR